MRIPVLHVYLWIFLSALAGGIAYGQAADFSVPDLDGNLVFTQNNGQWHQKVQYQARLNAGTLFIEKDRFTFQLLHPGDYEAFYSRHHHTQERPDALRGHNYQMIFEGAEPAAVLEGRAKLDWYSNYFIGDDSTKWATGVPSYKQVVYQGVYQNVDLTIYEQDGHLKYDFIVHPGGKTGDISIAYEGVDNLELVDGNLIVTTTANIVTEKEPVAYQIINGQKVEVPCRFRKRGNRVDFKLGKFDKNHPLVIDPVLTFSTYTGSTADNWGFTATYDHFGNFYAGGAVHSSGNYPTTTGAFQASSQGGAASYPFDVAITKFNAAGTGLVYSTYLGGNNTEVPHSLVVNSNNELFVFGSTSSTNFPITGSAYDKTYNGGAGPVVVTGVVEYTHGSDIFITKLNITGTALLGSTYVGGSDNDGLNIGSASTPLSSILNFNYSDHARGEIVTDDAGNVYVASSTHSSNFPTTPGAFQSAAQGKQDAVVFKMNPQLSALLWSTRFGGKDHDAAYSVKIDNAGNAVVGGGTISNDLPVTTGSLNTTYQGGSSDGFTVKFNSSGSAVLRSSYIGTSGYDQVYMVELDDQDNIFVTGQTSGNYPVVASPVSVSGGGQFVSKLNSNLSSFIYSLRYGKGDGDPEISPTAFLVDHCGNAYVSGWGGGTNAGGHASNTDYNILGLFTTPGAHKSSTDGSDFYLIVFDSTANSISYATYFGGNLSEEHVDGGTSRFDKSGIIYQAVCAGCGGFSDFPATPGAWSTTNQAPNCNLGAFKFEFDLVVEAKMNLNPSYEGCAPFTVNFQNISSSTGTQTWHFGDGTTSAAANPAKTYTKAGIYNVMLVATDLSTCNQRDTAYATITVREGIVTAAATQTMTEGCDSMFVQWANNSQNAVSYLWDFGDGTTSTSSSPSHSYYNMGTYNITLIAKNDMACNRADTVTFTVEYYPDVVAIFSDTLGACFPNGVTFSNTSINGVSYEWDFGDGATSTVAQPAHTYKAPGVYQIRLIVVDHGTCNLADTAFGQVHIYALPVASFTTDSDSFSLGAPVNFVNTSADMEKCFWTFGDGGFSHDFDPVHIYEKDGLNAPCLTIWNKYGCSDTICSALELFDNGKVFVPNAFSPNADNLNDVFYVKGEGIKHMNLKIFNRWGELVFESDDMNNGWDGIYNGQLQGNAVFVWYLETEMYGGRKVNLQGNVTLLR